MKIKLKLNNKQKEIINDWINTSNYVYNKTIEEINNGHKINFISLRDKLVTNETKKYNPIYKLLSDINIPLYNEKKELKKELNKINKKKKKNINDYNSIKNLTELIEKIDIKVKNNNKVRRDGIKNIEFENNDDINDW